MLLLKTLVLFAAAVVVSASPSKRDSSADILARQNGNCGNYIGDCYSNGCDPIFNNPSDTIGTCNAGDYVGCYCNKCGGGVGYTGSCNDNGCNGYQGVCTAGNYQGCQCD